MKGLTKANGIGIIAVCLILSVIMFSQYVEAIDKPIADSGTKLVNGKYKTFNQANQTVTLENSFFGLFSLGKTAEVKLLSNTYTCFTSCSAEGKTTLYEPQKLKNNVYFKDLNGRGSTIKDYKFLLKTGEKTDTYNTYSQECFDVINPNTTKSKQVCTQSNKVNGSYSVTTPIYSDYNDDVLPAGTYTWRIEGNKKANDNLDWVINVAGVDLTEFAYWIGQTPVAYWKFNEASGNAIDYTGLHNLTHIANNTFLGGKLANGARMGPATQTVFNTSGSTDFQLGTGNFSIAFWFNTTESGDTQMINSDDSGSGCAGNGITINNYIGDIIMCGGNSLFGDGGGTQNNGIWRRIVFVREGTGTNEFKKYVDNINTINDTMALDIAEFAYQLRFYTTGASKNQSFDDFQIFKGYAWTKGDVNTDWNAGAGQEANTSDPALQAPNVTLNLPSNNSNRAVGNIVFNYSVVGFSSLKNASLRIYNSSGLYVSQLNTTAVSNNTNNTINVSITVNGTYFWNVYVGDTNNLTGHAISNFTLVIQRSTINISSPLTGSNIFFTNNISLNLTGSSVSYANFPCWRQLDSTAPVALNSGTNITNNTLHSTTFVSSNGNHTINITCTIDFAGNLTESSTFRNILGGINITGRNATTNSVLGNWSVRFANNSYDVTYTNITTDTVSVLLDPSQISMGLSNITFMKQNLANISFQLNLSNSSILNFTAYFLNMNQLVTINTPINNSILTGGFNFSLNVTIPPFTNGGLNLSYTINSNSTTSGSLCTNCTNIVQALNGIGGLNNITVGGVSAYYSSGNVNYENETHSFTLFFGQFNVTIFNEMTDSYFNLTTTGLTSTSFNYRCDLPAPFESTRVISTALGTDFNISCTPVRLQLKMNWNSTLTVGALSEVFRARLPLFSAGELRFYMVDLTNQTGNQKTVKIIDSGAQYVPGGKFILNKIINNSTREIDSEIPNAANEIYNLLTIVNEQYQLQMSKTGQPTLSLGTLPGDTSTTKTINIPVLIFSNITSISNYLSYGFTVNSTTGVLGFRYNDLLSGTSRITFSVINASNVSQSFYSDTQYNLTTAYSWTFTVPMLSNQTYIMNFTATQSTYGTITDYYIVSFIRRIINIFGLIPISYIQIASLALIIFVALLFGSSHSGIGALIVSVLTGFLYFIGFISDIVGIGAVVLCVILGIISLISNRRGDQ